jgi:GNAT superfamily N-acetyltransferase
VTGTCEITPLAQADREDWGALWRAYLAFYETERPEEVFDTTFARFTDPGRADMLGWIARTRGRAVGLVHVIVHSHGWQVAPVTYLQDLYVEASARGQGIGRRLIETVFADADSADRPNVYWMTNRANTTARQLYDRIATPTDFMKYVRA